jgi:hypothetical protein
VSVSVDFLQRKRQSVHIRFRSQHFPTLATLEDASDVSLVLIALKPDSHLDVHRPREHDAAASNYEFSAGKVLKSLSDFI